MESLRKKSKFEEAKESLKKIQTVYVIQFVREEGFSESFVVVPVERYFGEETEEVFNDVLKTGQYNLISIIENFQKKNEKYKADIFTAMTWDLFGSGDLDEDLSCQNKDGSAVSMKSLVKQFGMNESNGCRIVKGSAFRAEDDEFPVLFISLNVIY